MIYRKLDDYLIGEMARQTKLPKKDFEHLAKCPMGQAEYEEAVREHL